MLKPKHAYIMHGHWGTEGEGWGAKGAEAIARFPGRANELKFTEHYFIIHFIIHFFIQKIIQKISSGYFSKQIKVQHFSFYMSANYCKCNNDIDNNINTFTEKKSL